MWNSDKVKEIVDGNKIVIFAKGTKQMPMCGFSMRAIDIMNQIGKPFEVVNIFDDPEIRPSLIAYSQWPTTPQLFVNGELIGGSDIADEMFQNGELKKKVEAAFSEQPS